MGSYLSLSVTWLFVCFILFLFSGNRYFTSYFFWLHTIYSISIICVTLFYESFPEFYYRLLPSPTTLFLRIDLHTPCLQVVCIKLCSIFGNAKRTKKQNTILSQWTRADASKSNSRSCSQSWPRYMRMEFETFPWYNAVHRRACDSSLTSTICTDIQLDRF